MENICGSGIDVIMCDKMPKQVGTTDCGIFAIATATSLLQSYSIQHFENFDLTPFP